MHHVTSLVTVSVALRRGFKEAGSVPSDVGDFWDKDS